MSVLYATALATSAAAGMISALALPWRGAPWARRAAAIGAGAWAAAAVTAWIARWIAAGHLPLFGTYESALSLAAVLAVTTLVWEGSRGLAGGVLPFAALVAAALLAHGLGYDPTPHALTISERSWVVEVHALAAWAAFAMLAVNAGVALTLVTGIAAEAAAAWLTRSLHLGFVLHSLMMASGSIYRFLLFGRAWSFDPVESLGLGAWVAYGTLLHLSLFAGWRGRRLAGWCLTVFALLVLSYRGIVYFPAWSTYHVFDLDLREHVWR